MGRAQSMNRLMHIWLRSIGTRRLFRAKKESYIMKLPVYRINSYV